MRALRALALPLALAAAAGPASGAVGDPAMQMQAGRGPAT